MALNDFAVAFLLVNVALLLALPRQWMLLPLLITACYMTRDQGILLGSLHFSVLRLVILAGVFRMVAWGPQLRGGLNGMDRLVLVWAGWLLASSVFHDDVVSALEFRAGLVYDVCGIYFLVRCGCQRMEDVVNLARIVAFILVPVAAAMMYEKLVAYNVFSVLGGLGALPEIRRGGVRSQGPFAHAILAGTVGAVCLPLTAALWKLDRRVAVMGGLACSAMVYASGSSGPILSALAGLVGLGVWRVRERTRILVALMIGGYVALELVMKDPAYFILARIDLTGGSTGWHRARLIQASIERASEWWVGGTDYTRHWIASGVPWSPSHVDITNHYVQMGVWAGLPVMLLFMGQMAQGFRYVGRILRRWSESKVPEQWQFMVWAAGASLFAHALTCMSVSYFDQSFIFLYIVLALIGSVYAEVFGAEGRDEVTVQLDAEVGGGRPWWAAAA